MHPAFVNGSFAHLRLGKLAPKHDPRTLRLAKYLDDAAVLPQLPDEVDYTLGVREWPMYGNNSYGDCTCAAAGHMVQVWTTAAASPKEPTEADVMALYWATGDPPNQPCSPGGATDTGRFEVDVLNYWRNTGIGTDKIVAYAGVDPGNADHMKAAVYLFGGVYTGIALPLTAQGQQVWDVNGDPSVHGSPAAPGSWGGHAVPFHAYDPAGFTCVTWGATLKLTSAFNNAYTDEAYAIITQDWLNALGSTPTGLDLAGLQADLAAIQDTA